MSPDSDMPRWNDVRVRTAPGLLRHGVDRHGGRPAVIAASGGHANALVEVSYSELDERARRVAAGMDVLGVEPGARVGLLADNRWFLEAITTYHASHLLGAINVALNGRWVAPELARALALVTPRLVVCGMPWYDICREAISLLPHGNTPRVVVIGGGSGDASADPVCFDWLLRNPALQSEYDVTETDDADWIFTSGTTGDPKAVRFSHGQTVATGMQVAHAWNLSPDDVYQSPSPYFTSTGCRTNLLGSLAACCTYLPDPVTDLTQILELARQYRPTVYFGVSSMFRLLLDQERGNLNSFDSLRRLVYGGMVMPRSFHEELNAAFEGERGTEVMHLMGFTEGGPTGVYLHPDDHHRKPGAVGDRGFSPWTEFSVGREVDDRQGELCIRSPSVTTAITTADDGSTDPRRDSGWLPTGDIVSVDDEGFLSFVDRTCDVIRRGGMNIPSGEVEAVFQQHPAVVQVAVVAKPHRVLGEDLCAFVVAGLHQVTPDDLRARCADHLASYKVPRDIRVVDELPLNAMGRVRKGQLRQALLDE